MPRIIGYRKQVTVPLAHWCRNRCAYCGFYSEDNDVVNKADVLRQLKAAKRQGFYNVLFMSGENPDRNSIIKALLKSEGYKSFGDYLLNLCRLAVRQGMVPALCVGHLPRAQLGKFKGLVSHIEVSLENTSDRLNKEGLPHFGSPGKEPKTRLAVLRAAGEMKIPVSTGLLVGIGETRRERYKTLEDIKSLQDRYGNIKETFVRAYSVPNGNGYRDNGADVSLVTDTVRYAGAIMPGMSLQVSISQLASHYRELVKVGVNDFGYRTMNGDMIVPGAKWPNMARLAKEMRRMDVRLVERPAAGDDFLNSKWYSSALLKIIKKRSTVTLGSPSANG